MSECELSADQLNQRLVRAHPTLSPQLQRIARYVLDNPSGVATSTIADLSDAVGVQPSSFIRFSKAVGFKGFSEIQRIVKTQVRAQAPSNYFDRLRASDPGAATANDSVARFAKLAENSLNNLPQQIAIDAAAQIIADSRITHIVGLRRAFGIANYLNYLLAGFEAPVHLMEFAGGMVGARTSFLEPSDCVIAITFPNYTSHAIDVAKLARERQLKVIAMTHSLVSPLAEYADVTLLTDPATDSGFRSAVGSMVTAQALAVTYGELKSL